MAGVWDGWLGSMVVTGVGRCCMGGRVGVQLGGGLGWWLGWLGGFWRVVEWLGWLGWCVRWWSAGLVVGLVALAGWVWVSG